MASGIRVEGLRELDRAFGKISKDVRRDLRVEIRKVAEPVRVRAESLAVADIRNIGGTWSRMRIGVTTFGAYVAPKARRRGGSPRPNLGGLLMNKSMVPALHDESDVVVAGIDAMLGRLGGEAGF
jgi:hypothetical protein